MNRECAIVAIDGNNLLFRCYHGSKLAGNNRGEFGSMMQMFLVQIQKVCKIYNPGDVIVTWDNRTSDKPSLREEMDAMYRKDDDTSAYKGNRKPTHNIYDNIDVVKSMLDKLGVTQITPYRLEADDIMYWLSNRYHNALTIVSADNDLYQMVGNGVTSPTVYNPKLRREITSGFLFEAFGVYTGIDYVIYKSLQGDRSDNILKVGGVSHGTTHKIIDYLHNNRYNFLELRESGILNQDDFGQFVRNLKMIKFDPSYYSEEETNHYLECISKPTNIDIDGVMAICKEYHVMSPKSARTMFADISGNTFSAMIDKVEA